ncbi:hypothetical protein ABPG72_011542 [Tetrahymena utriculariae]
MGIQISQCCSSKKNAVNEETLQRKSKNQMHLISANKQHKENSVRSNQSSGKMASNTLINEVQHDQARSVQEKNAILTEDILSRRVFLADLKQSDQQKQQEKITQSIKIHEEFQKSFSDVDEQKEQIDDFNRALIVLEDQNEQIKSSTQEMQQKTLKKVIELDKVHLKSNCYRDNFDKVQIPMLDMILSGEKDLKEFDEEDSNSDSAEEENKQESIKKGAKSLQAQKNYEIVDGSQDGQDGQEDDEEEEEEEEENSEDESYDLFDSGGVLERIMRENRHKKNGLGIDSHSGQTYILKQYSPEDVQELIFDSDLAQRIKLIQNKNDCFCMIHAIRKQSDEGLLIVQNHEKGGSLSLFLDTAFNEKEAKIWIIKILKALQILHESHLVHGNLKPNNILLGQGQLKLTDINMFKNMKHLHNLYSAPELLQKNLLTEKSDIWSACLIFIEMRTGVMPYLEKDPDMTVEKLKEKIERMELRFPFDIETQEFIRMMNNIDPNKRKTANELLNSRYLKCENHNFDKQYLNQLQKKHTLRKLNNTKNFDQSMMMSKPLLSEQQTFMYNSQIKPGGIQKGTTINIDKLNDKGTKQYGVTSVLTVVNIKERDLQQQESYMPISVANLMTTQLTNNGMVSQQISNKDNKDDSSGPISQNLKQEIQNRKSADYNKQASNNQQQQQQKQMQQENISKVLKQWITVKTTLEQQQEQEEKHKQFQIQQEKLINQIKQRENEEDEEDGEEVEVEEEEDNQTENQNDKNQNNGLGKDLDRKQTSKNSEIRNNQRKQTKSINAQNNFIQENEARMKQLEIEQKLLDILNQNLGGEDNSFVSDTSQDLKNSFIDGTKAKYKSSFQDLSLVQSSKVPSSQIRFATKLLEKNQNPQKKEGDIISDTKQMQSIQIISPKDEEDNLYNNGKSAADKMIEQMNKILNEGATIYSQESLDDLKRQISTQNFVGLRKLLTISSQQKTSNSLKTLRNLGNSNAKQGKCKTENSPMRDERQKQSSRLQVDDQGYYFIEDYIQKTKNVKKDDRGDNNNASKDIKNTSFVNNYTQNDQTKQNDQKQEEIAQDPEYQKQLLQQEIEQKLLDILNQNGDCDEGSFLQGSQEIIKIEDKNIQEENKIPSINQNILTQKNDAYQKQQSTNSLRIIKVKSNRNANSKTPEQIVDEMNRILNEGISAYSLESYEEIKRQISTQNFTSLKRTLSNNKQLRTLNSIKTQKTLLNSSIINKSMNSNNLGKNKVKLDQNVQE